MKFVKVTKIDDINVGAIMSELTRELIDSLAENKVGDIVKVKTESPEEKYFKVVSSMRTVNRHVSPKEFKVTQRGKITFITRIK